MRLMPLFTRIRRNEFRWHLTFGALSAAHELCIPKNSNPDVMMVQSAKDGVRFDASNSLNLASDRRILIQ